MKLAKVINLGEWQFEIKSGLLRKTANYGEQYSGIVTLTIADGVPHFEGLHCDNFTRQDYQALYHLVSLMGYSTFIFKRLRNGVEVVEEREIKKVHFEVV